MQKLSRKLLISIMSLAFAVITLGASTFAWFTLSNKAEVQTFEAQVTAGAGIEVSLDDETYKSTITSGEIETQIDGNTNSTRTLDDVTSADGKVFQTITAYNVIEPTSSGFIWFDLYFRSPDDNVKVYLLDNSYVKSTGVNWIPDATFEYMSTQTLTAGGSAVKLYAANALRISTEEYTATEQTVKTTPIDYSLGANPANVFELDPTTDLVATYGNQRLDQAVKSYGSVAYYNSKYSTTPLDTSMATGNLPVVLNRAALKSPLTLVSNQSLNSVATLTAQFDNPTTYYYSAIRVRMWLEGWDPDMYNSIMADTLQLYLNFGGSAVIPTIEVTPNTIDLTTEASATFTYTISGIDFEPQVVSADETKVTISVNAETNTVTVTKVAPSATPVNVTISLPGYDNVTPINIPVTLPLA